MKIPAFAQVQSNPDGDHQYRALLGIRLPADPFHRNNVFSAFLMGAVPAIAGSASSILLGTFFGWGIFCLLIRRFPLRLTQSDQTLAYTFTAFVLAVLATALLGQDRSYIPDYIFWIFAYLSVWAVLPRLRASYGIDLLPPYIVGAAVGLILALPLALFQTYGLGHRAEGGTGNPAVFAIVCLCLAPVAGLNVTSRQFLLRVLAVAGFVAGLACVAISTTVGVWIAAIPVALAYLIYAGSTLSRHVVLAVAAGLIAALIIGFYALPHSLYLRLGQFVASDGSDVQTIADRLSLWRAAIPLIAESPLWGHGIQNRMLLVMQEQAARGDFVSPFTHVHNAYLSFAIDGGIIVLTALLAVLTVPILTAVRAPRDENHRKRLFLAIFVTAGYAFSGLTQIMFKHDILDSFFIFAAILVAASVPEPTVEPASNEVATGAIPTP